MLRRDIDRRAHPPRRQKYQRQYRPAAERRKKQRRKNGIVFDAGFFAKIIHAQADA